MYPLHETHLNVAMNGDVRYSWRPGCVWLEMLQELCAEEWLHPPSGRRFRLNIQPQSDDAQKVLRVLKLLE